MKNGNRNRSSVHALFSNSRLCKYLICAFNFIYNTLLSRPLFVRSSTAGRHIFREWRKICCVITRRIVLILAIARFRTFSVFCFLFSVVCFYVPRLVFRHCPIVCGTSTTTSTTGDTNKSTTLCKAWCIYICKQKPQ